MSQPVTVDIPHKLGLAGAHAKLDGGIGKLASFIPGGAVTDHHWEGETMHFTVSAMGQTIASRIEVMEDKVHAVIDLPPFLALFADKIRAKLAKDGPALLK